MRSCIRVFYIALFLAPGPRLPRSRPGRALPRARRPRDKREAAAAAWEQHARRPTRRTSSRRGSWRARCTGSATHGAAAARQPALERGVAAGRQAATLAPNRPEGHFWMAANMGALAESFGMRQGLRYRGAIKDALETVLRIDPAFQQGSADRALGRWYFKVPGLFGGSKTEVRRAPAQVAHLLSRQHGVALLPGGDAVRAGSRSRSAGGAAEGARGAAQSGLGARGPRVQGTGAAAAQVIPESLHAADYVTPRHRGTGTNSQLPI